MTTMQELRKIAALDWERDPENDGGYVAPVSRDDLATLAPRLKVAGYTVSDSRDDAGQTWLWVL